MAYTSLIFWMAFRIASILQVLHTMQAAAFAFCCMPWPGHVWQQVVLAFGIPVSVDFDCFAVQEAA